jgi:hypothetical protein
MLVAWDTDQIKGYVFATQKLREIRGASALLDSLNEKEIVQLIGREHVVYAGGGAAMAEIPDPVRAQALIHEVERMYRYHTSAAEITGACLEMDDASIGFGEYARRLNYKLRIRKDEKSRRRNWLTSPVVKVCESCGQYPAAHHVKQPEEDFVCNACFIKRTVSQQVRNGTFSFGSRLTELLAYARAHGRWHQASIDKNTPEDFNDIGSVASPRGYIGFIYCDGNRMGALLQHLTQRESFSRFSEGVRRTLHEVIFDVLCHHFPTLRPLPAEPGRHILPFEIIFIGGDDMMLVVAADKAMDVALSLCQGFAERTRPVLESAGLVWQREHLSLSSAVVLSHASLPIYHLQATAEELLKSAKRRSLKIYEEHKTEVGCIDFHLVTASATEAPMLMREGDWVRRDGPITLTLTERPYTPKELEALLARIRALQTTRFPKSKLHMLYETIVGQSKAQSMFQWAFVMGRAPKGQLSALCHLFAPTADLSLWPWRERESGQLSTPIVDVTELYDFVQ